MKDVSLALLFCGGLSLVSTTPAAAAAVAWPAAAADSLDDGPHIYWQSDSTAIVLYLCGGEILTRTFEVADTLRFNGLCGDSLTAYTVPAAQPAIGPYVFEGAAEIFAVSDIHGEYEALVDLLRNAGIIDDALRWSWGTGHLVVNGDVTDRGDKVTECMWLIYRLEQEARQAGGHVHFVLGNHEIMTMQGDNRYLNKKYRDGIAVITRIRNEDLYGPDMELGRWLRSKHSAITVNDILFVHGGIGPHIVERGMSLEEINESARARIDLRSYQVVFDELPRFLFKSMGPFWYRGYHEARSGYTHATPEEVQAILDYYGVSTIVVGHSEIERVESFYGGRVFDIDVPLKELGSFQGLLWNQGEFYRVTGSGERQPLTPAPQPSPSSP